MVNPDPSTKSKFNMGQRSRFSIDREDIGSKKAHVASFQMLKYQIGDYNVGRLFKKYQADAVTIVNKFDVSATLSIISIFCMYTTESCSGS